MGKGRGGDLKGIYLFDAWLQLPLSHELDDKFKVLVVLQRAAPKVLTVARSR